MKKIIKNLPLAILLTSALALGSVVTYFQVFQITNVQVNDWYTVSNQKILRYDTSTSTWVEIDPQSTPINGGDKIRVIYTFKNDANRDVDAKHELTITESSGPASVDDIDVVKFKLWSNAEEDITTNETVNGNDYVVISSSYSHTAETSDDAYFEVHFNAWFEPQTVTFTVNVKP